MCCFLFIFIRLFRTWEKRDVSPASPSNLPIPLIAERIDLIRKLSKIFIRHALTFFITAMRRSPAIIRRSNAPDFAR